MSMDSALWERARITGDGCEQLPDYVFDPSDPWTLTFQAGLKRAGLGGRRVHEVGVGSGVNVAFMLRTCGAELVLGSDVDPRLPVLARKFVTRAAPDVADRFRPIYGSVNLFDLPADLADVTVTDVVVGCLPHVPDPEDAMYGRFHLAELKREQQARKRRDDHLAHYYPWAAFHQYPFNAVGLGLIEALLRKARSRLPRAEVVLNLGCRVGRDVLLRLFRANGYQPEELVSNIVRQDANTDISFFVALEAALRGTRYERDFVCEFYADPQGRCPMSASEARAGLEADPAMPVFHEICVLRGHPLAAASEAER